MLAIGADNQGDAFYRYKMPKLVAKIEGRGNGIKTNVVNNVEIAKALERPPGYIIKYFGCELGAQTKYEESSGTSIVNGAHDAGKLSELLEGFIKRYVQCYSCGNPETHVKIKKERLYLKCKACGFVSDVDPRHKLNTYILNHPPENKMTKEEKKLKKAEEERMKDAQEAAEKEKKEKKKEKKDKKDKKDKKRKGDSAEKADAAEEEREEAEEEAEEEDEDGVVWLTDTSKEAAKKRAEEQLSSVTAAMVTVGNIEAEEEAARKRAEKEARKAAEAEARRKAEEEAARLKAEQELAAKAKQLTLDAIPAGKLPVAEAKRLLGVLLEQGDVAEVDAAVKKMTVEGGLSGKMRALYEALFAGLEEGQRLPAVIKARKQLLRANAKDTPGQLAQLVALEHYLVVTANDRMKEAAVVLKTLYDEDIIEDGLVVAWANKTDAAHVLGVPSDGARLLRRQDDLQKLVSWLAEESDEEDDEEDDDEEDEE